jgi:hypothetical protein
MRQGTKELAHSAQASLESPEGWRKRSLSLNPALERVLRRAALLFLFGALAGPLIGFSIQYIARGNLLEISSGESPARVILFFAAFGVLMSYTCFITCGLPARYINRALQHFPRYIQIPLRALASFGGTLLGLAVSSQVIWWIFQVHLIKEEDMRAALALSAILSCVLTLIITAFAQMRSEIRRVEAMIYESKLKQQKLAERTAMAQVRALQAQINPHFFFNTLSSIIALLNIDPAAARSILIALAEMYRYTLRCTNSRLVPLAEEMDFVKAYLGIEEVRFRDRLRLDIQTPRNLDSLELPGLVLQPMVENAIKHGIARNIGSGVIKILVNKSDQDFRITVYNTSEQEPELRVKEWFIEGHALKNVDDRLSAIYGKSYDLKADVRDGEVCVTLRLPILKKEHD